MKLGISSLSHIITTSWHFQGKNLHKLLIEATRTCLEFSEVHQLDVCELVIDPDTTLELEKKNEFIEVCKEFALPKQIHAALIDVSLCSNNPKISEGTLDTFKNNVDIANALGARTITIHPGVANIPIPVLKGNNYSTLLHQLKELLAYSKGMGVKICLENMDPKAGLCRNDQELLTLYQDIGDPDLWFTYDTSHLWMNSCEYSQFIDTLHPYIGNVHLADNADKKFDQHPCIGMGNVPFPEILNILRTHNYSNSLVIELMDVKGLKKSIDYIRKIL